MTVTSQRRPRPRSLFGNILRRELDGKGVSVKQLARLIATERAVEAGLETAPTGAVESVRRLLNKYLIGETSPEQPMRESIARHLGSDPAVFADEAIQLERRRRIADALLPLADVLLEIATDVATRAKEKRR
jgi:transcriptional regulator with XRE-family HTH domain